MSAPSDAMQQSPRTPLKYLSGDMLGENVGLVVDPRYLVNCDGALIDLVL